MPAKLRAMCASVRHRSPWLPASPSSSGSWLTAITMPGADLEAGQHRLRNEVHDAAPAHRAAKSAMRRDEERGGGGQLGVARGIARGERAERHGQRRARSTSRADGELARRAEKGVGDAAEEVAVQAGLHRHAGELRVGDRARYRVGGKRAAGQRVVARVAAAIAREPRQPAGERRAGDGQWVRRRTKLSLEGDARRVYSMRIALRRDAHFCDNHRLPARSKAFVPIRLPHFFLAVAALAACAASAQAPAPRKPDPVALLAEAKRESGGNAWDALRSQRSEVKLSAAGLEGTAERC